jgi:hypothetical protein
MENARTQQKPEVKFQRTFHSWQVDTSTMVALGKIATYAAQTMKARRDVDHEPAASLPRNENPTKETTTTTRLCAEFLPLPPLRPLGLNVCPTDRIDLLHDDGCYGENAGMEYDAAIITPETIAAWYEDELTQHKRSDCNKRN